MNIKPTNLIITYINNRYNPCLKYILNFNESFGYFGTFCASDSGLFMPVIPVQTVPLFKCLA